MLRSASHPLSSKSKHNKYNKHILRETAFTFIIVSHIPSVSVAVCGMISSALLIKNTLFRSVVLVRYKTSSAATFFSSLTRAVAFPSAVPLHEDTGVHALLPAALFCIVTRTTVVVSAYRHRPVPQCRFQCQSFRP